LQAQIEPHFLFNTLANVGSLIDSDPPRARRLLDRLNDWLRVALVRTRSQQASLGDELALLENWLEILADRYCPRLTWQIDADAACRSQPFPPMLLQPLAENAIRHGIEPKVGGGHLRISARLEAHRLHIEVCDNGVGLAQTSGQTSALSINGTGLTNIRARLQALYGDAARLDLNTPLSGGITACLELPCAR
jgi:LytS/YehU family sensor histidine kinase